MPETDFELEFNTHVIVCPECADVLGEFVWQTGTCSACGSEVDGSEAVWIGWAEHPAQQKAAAESLEILRSRARAFPASQLAESLDAALAEASLYAIMDLRPDALTSEVNERIAGKLAPELGGIPSLYATSAWREARGDGYYFGGPTQAERKVFQRYFQRAAETLGDPEARGRYDKQHGFDRERGSVVARRLFEPTGALSVLGFASFVWAILGVDELAETGLSRRNAVVLGFAVIGVALAWAMHRITEPLVSRLVAKARAEGRPDVTIVRYARILPWVVALTFVASFTVVFALSSG